MDIRLLVLDVDGTIAGQSNSVSKAVVRAIQAAQAQGIQVAIATGRMYCSALRFHLAVASQLPILAYNGAWIQNPLTEEIHQQINVAAEDALFLLDYFEQGEWRSQIGVHFYSGDRLYVREITPHTERYAQRAGVEPIAVGDLRQMLDAPLTKILALGQNPQSIAQIMESLRSRFSRERLYLTQSTPTFFEVTHPQVNKGAAVRFLAEELLGLTAENVMAIGDNFNDAEMLDYAGLGVAMGNAPDAVKAIAQWVAPDVEFGGAAAAIQQFLL